MTRNIFENIVIHHHKEQGFFENCAYAAIRFFEILFIEDGKGEIIVNGHNINYGPNQLFIFVPNDKYTFQVKEATTLSTIKFLNSFFVNAHSDDYLVEKKEWFKKIEFILHSTNRTSEIKLHSEDEEASLRSLFAVICREYNNEALRNNDIIKNMLQSILHIIVRNLNYTSTTTASSKIQEIINYIHSNIYESDQLLNKALADEFHISDNYIGQYFKKQMGISLKKYILNHKVKLAETRLKHTDLTISEIAMELGFTDSSHLDKTFVSYKGLSAGNFRQEQRVF